MASSCTSFSSIIAVPVPCPARKPCRASWNWRLACRQVYMSASTTFHRVSSSTMSRVSVAPLGMRTKTVHPTYCGISPVRHMCWTMSTRHIHHSVYRVRFNFSLGYTSLSNCLKCSTQRWVCQPALSGHRKRFRYQELLWFTFKTTK